MNRDFRRLRKTAFAVLVTVATIPFFLSRRVAEAAEGQADRDRLVRTLSYHRHPPREPLPITLGPGRFAANPAAYLAYSLAARIKPVLYQEPCFCSCNQSRGHKSLLDCYTDDHASVCPICRLEAIYAFEQHQRGKSPKQIRKAMLRGDLTTLDMDTYLRNFGNPGAKEDTALRKQNAGTEREQQ